MVNALVETGAGWVKAKAQDAVAVKGVAALLPLLGERLIGGERDLDSADYFRDVIGVDGCGRGWVEPGEETVQICGPTRRGDAAKTFALSRLLRWRWEEAIDEGSEVKASTACDDGEMPAFRDAGKSFASLTAVVASGAGFVGPHNVDHVVRDEGALLA